MRLASGTCVFLSDCSLPVLLYVTPLASSALPSGLYWFGLTRGLKPSSNVFSPLKLFLLAFAPGKPPGRTHTPQGPYYIVSQLLLCVSIPNRLDPSRGGTVSCSSLVPRHLTGGWPTMTLSKCDEPMWKEAEYCSVQGTDDALSVGRGLAGIGAQSL